MATVHVETPEKQQIQYTEDQFRAYFEEGAFHSDSIFLMEGMVEWRPVVEYTAILGSVPQQHPPAYQTIINHQPELQNHPTTHKNANALEQNLGLGEGIQSATPHVAKIRDLRGITKNLRAWLITYAIFETYYIFVKVNSYFTNTQDAIQIFTPIFILLLVNWLVSVLIIISTVVHFCKWMYRANKNLRGLGANDLTDSPRWAAAWIFIPFVNLYKPYQAMSEIARASISPQSWRNVTTPSIIAGWWFMWIASIIAGSVSGQISFHENQKVSFPLMWISNIVDLLSSILFIIGVFLTIKITSIVQQNLD